MLKSANDLVIETKQELRNRFLRYAKQYETEPPDPSRQGGRTAPFRFAVSSSASQSGSTSAIAQISTQAPSGSSFVPSAMRAASPPSP